MVLSANADAGEEIIMRKSIAFDACPKVISGILTSLGADEGHVHQIADTAAHYSVKLVARAANLEFVCNAVTEQITVTKITPGDLVTAAN